MSDSDSSWAPFGPSSDDDEPESTPPPESPPPPASEPPLESEPPPIDAPPASAPPPVEEPPAPSEPPPAMFAPPLPPRVEPLPTAAPPSPLLWPDPSPPASGPPPGPAPEPSSGQQAPWPPTGFQQSKPVPSDATVALVLGIASLLFCGFVGPFAIHYGLKARRQIDADPLLGGRGLATWGYALGIVSTAVLIIGLVLIAAGVIAIST